MVLWASFCSIATSQERSFHWTVSCLISVVEIIELIFPRYIIPEKIRVEDGAQLQAVPGC